MSKFNKFFALLSSVYYIFHMTIIAKVILYLNFVNKFLILIN